MKVQWSSSESSGKTGQTGGPVDFPKTHLNIIVGLTQAISGVTSSANNV